jgi:nucleoside-diphosphate-sugar epimerase
MRVLVTGSGGFVGSHVARLAARKEAEVTAHVSRSDDLSRLEGITSKVTLVQGDLADPGVLDRLADLKPEVCIHSAWCGGPDYLDSFRNIESISVTLRLAVRLGQAGCKRMVGLGTCLEYDTSVSTPLAETATLAPRRLYSAAKLGTCQALQQVGLLTGMATAWARLFYIYGPSEQYPRLVPSVTQALLQEREVEISPGEQIRDFLHVGDVASAVWAIATSAVEGPVNVGSGTPITVAELVREIGAIVGRPNLVKRGALPYRPGDPMFVCANNRRLVEECRWKPHFSLNTGLADTIDWWRRRLEERKPSVRGG